MAHTDDSSGPTISTPSRPSIMRDLQDWPTFRRGGAMVVNHQIFDGCIGVIIMLNAILIVWQADYEAQCFPKYAKNKEACPFKSDKIPWVKIASLTLLTIYTLEAFLRIFVERTKYFKIKLNMLDFLVIVVGWVGVAAEGTLNLALLRLIRLTRLSRAFRILFQVRELYLLLSGVATSIRAILLGTCLLFALLAVYAIILVEYVHPVNSQIEYHDCPECDEGFQTVWYSVLTLFKQLIAGDSWIISFPLLKKSPMLAPLLIFIVVTITLGVLNLILTVIVERAAEARERDLRLKSAEFQETKKDLIKLCHAVDTSGDGKVTLDELVDAYHNVSEFRILMTTLDVQEHDLSLLLNLLDVDNSGYLDCQEFSEELIKLKSNDTSMLLALNRYQLAQLGRRVEKNVETVLERVMKTTERHESQLELISGKLDKILDPPSGMAFNQTQCLNLHPSRGRLIAPGGAATFEAGNPSAHTAECLDELDRDIRSTINIAEQLAEQAAQQLSTLLEHASHVDSMRQQASHLQIASDLKEYQDTKQVMVQLAHDMSTSNMVLWHDAQLAFGSIGEALSKNTLLFQKLRQTGRMPVVAI